jgi:hypothetical protein
LVQAAGNFDTLNFLSELLQTGYRVSDSDISFSADGTWKNGSVSILADHVKEAVGRPEAQTLRDLLTEVKDLLATPELGTLMKERKKVFAKWDRQSGEEREAAGIAANMIGEEIVSRVSEHLERAVSEGKFDHELVERFKRCLSITYATSDYTPKTG